MARQCFVAPIKAHNCRPKACYSNKSYENHAAKQHKASQHRCAKVKASQVASVDALLRAWLCGPVSMCLVHIAVCESMVEGHKRNQAMEARRLKLLQASLSSSKQYPYRPSAQVKANLMMQTTFHPVNNALKLTPAAPTQKAQMLQLLSTSVMQLAKTIPSYTIMPKYIPVMIPIYNIPKFVPVYQMVQLPQVFPANTLQLAAPATYYHHKSLQCTSLVTRMPFSSRPQLSSLVFTCSCMWPMKFSGLQLSGVNTISLLQPLAPKYLLLGSFYYSLMRPMGFNTLLVASLNISLWHVSTSSCQLCVVTYTLQLTTLQLVTTHLVLTSSCQLFVVTYTLQLTTLQLVTTHLVLTMQPAGYSTAVRGLLTCQAPSVTAPLQPHYYQMAVLPVYTHSIYCYTHGNLRLPACTSISYKQQLPLLPAAYSSREPEASSAAAVKGPSMRQALKCAVLGLVNTVINSLAAGLFEYAIKGVESWS